MTPTAVLPWWKPKLPSARMTRRRGAATEGEEGFTRRSLRKRWASRGGLRTVRPGREWFPGGPAILRGGCPAGGSNDAPVLGQPRATRPLQELQIPSDVGRSLRRRNLPDERPAADDGGHRAPRRRRPEHLPQVARPDALRGHHPRARGHPRRGIRAL